MAGARPGPVADLFVAADPAGRDAIEKAVLKVNSQLAGDPWELGQSRSNRFDRSWSVPRLAVLFRIDPALERSLSTARSR